MKKVILILLIKLFSTAMSAQEYHPLHIREVFVKQEEQSVSLSFSVIVSEQRTGRSTYLLTPVITDSVHRVSFPPILVRQRMAARAWSRHVRGDDSSNPEAIDRIFPVNSVVLDRGDTVRYRVEIPFQYWMHGSRIQLERLQLGCGSACLDSICLLNDVLPAPVPQPVPVVVQRSSPSVGEQLDDIFSFVLPAADYDDQEPIKFYDDERDNALTVYYRINRFDIEAEYLDNHRTLVNLMAAIRIISESFDAQVERVVVAGFASPEGPFAFNDRLAWERAVSVKEYVLKNSDLEDHSIAIFNGSADWRGLRLLVQQDENLPGRLEVLEILENRKQAERIPAIRQLDAGATYRYMTEHTFPRLRNGAFIRVYYNNCE